MKVIHYIWCLLILIPLTSSSQDSVKVFTQKQLIWFVENYHPISVQGNLLLNQGETEVRKARGLFDPYIHSNLDQKYFDEKEYYSILNSGLKIPTWYGIELKTGFDQNRGVFLNPEDNVPGNGLWYAGVSLPVGQGLFIDKRRATLKQAQIFAESTYAAQQKLMNDLYYNAIKQYWSWVKAWNQYQVYEESVELALERFEGVKQNFLLGEIPAIDTLEAFIQVQSRQMNRNQYQLKYLNETLELSNFLWFEDNAPLVITDSLRPPLFDEIRLTSDFSNYQLQELLDGLDETHPEMQLFDYKLASMEVERRLNAENLKPKINVNYNALNEPVNSDITNNYSVENYKWGLEFAFPLFLREERGELQLTQLKIQDTQLGQQQKLLELQNKVRSYYNEQINLQGQVVLFTDAVNNYDQLLQGERQKYDSGESSLFLINSREINLIRARLQLIELSVDYYVANVGVAWAANRLYQ